MGRTEQRFWDENTFTSRAALPTDPARDCFAAYIPHPIAGWGPDLHTDTWHQISTATERCHELARATDERNVLAAEWLLDRSESIASSTIEEIRPSARRVARAAAQLDMFDETPRGTEMQALRNIAATQQAIDMGAAGHDLTRDSLCAVHCTLVGEDDPISGRIRDRQNWVGSGALGSPLQARHVGPPPEQVNRLLDDLIAYVNQSEGNPIVRAAIAHAQFETIHPFPDGNGRTGRALTQYMLRREGLVSHGALPVSSSLMLNKEAYFDALDATRVVCGPDTAQRSKTYRPWIEMMAQSTFHACLLRERLIKHVDALSERWELRARQARIRRSSVAHKLLDQLPKHPVLTSDRVVNLLSVEPRTAQRAVNQLERIGILVQRSAGRRNRVFECPDMMDAFTEAAREQPAGNLSLATRSDTPGPPLHTSDVPDSNGTSNLCGAITRRGRRCRHPMPRPGGTCPAGHRRT